MNTLFNSLMNEEWFTAFPPKHLKSAMAGGTALHHAVAARWQRITGPRVTEGFGLTECAPVVSFNPMSGVARPDSIGIPVPGTEVRLIDDNGVSVPQGEPGELIMRGPQTMQGDWQRPAETDQVLRNGWLHTGDVAVMDAQGYFRTVDRKKDLVLVSGFNVYPNEVEDALAKMNAVLAHGRTLLTDDKMPKPIVFRDGLPKTPVGKILRKDLKAELKTEFAKQARA